MFAPFSFIRFVFHVLLCRPTPARSDSTHNTPISPFALGVTGKLPIPTPTGSPILTLYTFYQPVFYATHDQHFPSESEEKAAFWVGFGEYCGDAMTHKLLDKIIQKIIYRSTVRPITKSNPNHRLDIDGGESGTSMGASEGSKPTKTPEEKAAFWVGFGEHCGDAMTHKLLDKIIQKIIYRSTVRPITKSNPNHRLDIDGGESGTSMGASEGSKPTKTPKLPTVFIRSRQDDAGPSIIKPMPEFDPDSLIGRTFLLPPQENGERLRAKVTKEVVEQIEAADGLLNK